MSDFAEEASQASVEATTSLHMRVLDKVVDSIRAAFRRLPEPIRSDVAIDLLAAAIDTAIENAREEERILITAIAGIE